MKKVKLFEDYSIEEKKITIEWDDDNHSFVFSDGEVARVDYDGDFQYRGEWFQTIDHESGDDLIKDLEKKFKKDKFAYVGESYIKEGKVKVFVDKIVSRMVEGGLGVSYSYKLREEIKDKIEGIVKDTLKKYDYVVESKESDALAKEIDKAMMEIDELMSYKDFADAVATILRDLYGTHNYMPFIKELQKRL